MAVFLYIILIFSCEYGIIFYIMENLDAALKVLNKLGESSYIVGGAVRDYLLRKDIFDIDICTAKTPDEVVELLDGYDLDTKFMKYGSVKIKGENAIEITTFRREDDYTDGRHPSTLSFTGNVKEDLIRRDFTINTMLMDENKEIYDYLDAKKDLNAKILKTVINPYESFAKDYLRILRLVRFAAKLGFKIEKETFKAAQKYAPFVKILSKDKFREEFNKILLLDDVQYAFKLMHELGILKEVLPEIDNEFNYDQNNPYHSYDLFTHTMKAVEATEKDLPTRLAALFHDVAKPLTRSEDGDVSHYYDHDKVGAEMAADILKGFNYDKKTINLVYDLILKHMKQDPNFGIKAVRRLYNYFTKENIYRYVDLIRADTIATRPGRELDNITKFESYIKEIEESLDKSGELKLAVNGNDLIAMGYEPGKKFTYALGKIKDMVSLGEVENDRKTLLKLLKKYMEEE